MPIIKCKMCGGDIELAVDKTFGTCEYCGSTMTLPKVSDEQKAAAFNRGNHFRRIGEFDKALAVYERIVAEDDSDAEAHWCCALCRFGIEYVEDPATYEWLPTCHRASFDSFLEDVDYLAAIENSDGITRRQYQKDAAKIAEVQRGILATSQNTEPYDVFISYKEQDENGNRTRDSILAQEIYYRLTEKGWRVFFSRISLEDVPGTQYEPYIFAALNSAKVMIVVGTSAENLNAVWVKNEWSRFLSMMRKDRSKLLIPCYRDMDPYDLPEQLAVLMSYDMGKIGFVQDLIRGVDKVLGAEKKDPEPVKEKVIVQQNAGGPNITALLERGNMALEDSEWNKAREFFEQVLNMDAKCGNAYLGLAMVDAQKNTKDGYSRAYIAPDSVLRKSKNVFRARRFNPELEKWFADLDEEGHREDEKLRLKEERARRAQREKEEAVRLEEEKERRKKEMERLERGKKVIHAVGAALAEINNPAIPLEKQLHDIRAKAANINTVYNSFDDVQEEIMGIDNSIHDCKHRIIALENAKNSLSPFNMIKKRQIDTELEEIKQKMQGKENEKDSLNKNLLGFCNKNQAKEALEEAKQKMSEIESKIADRNEQAERTYSLSRAIDLLKNDIQVFKTVVQNEPHLLSLLDEEGCLEKTLFFGRYPQTKEGSLAPIEWQVLAKEKKNILVISKYALDCRQYNTVLNDVTWSACSLRKWLNDEFLNMAFNTEEQTMIPKTIVPAEKGNVLKSNCATENKVFLLSASQVKQYLKTNGERQSKPTNYAIAQGCLIDDEKKTCWWSRSSGRNVYYPVFVQNDGCLDFSGHKATTKHGIRPAMWIQMDA